MAASMDVMDKIRQLLKSHGGAMHVDDIAKRLGLKRYVVQVNIMAMFRELGQRGRDTYYAK